MEFELENPLTSFKEHQSDTIPFLFSNESDHMPSSITFQSNEDIRFSIRRQAISLILQKQAEPWIARLLVVSCLSLAAKIKNTDLSLLDLQRDEGFIFDAPSIHRMELLILTTLNWRMRSITPFSFLHFFVSLFELKDPSSSRFLKDRASEILLKSQCEIKFMEYKPSIMAASALLYASHELFPMQFPSFKAAISACEHVNEGSLLKCLGVLEEMVTDWYMPQIDAVSGSTKTPISVLDRHCTSTASKNNASPERDNIKRRKLNEFYNDHLFHVTQIQRC
ncbi:hypothetical protein LguiA_015060 [Lonicera macranthoides]